MVLSLADRVLLTVVLTVVLTVLCFSHSFLRVLFTVLSLADRVLLTVVLMVVLRWVTPRFVDVRWEHERLGMDGESHGVEWSSTWGAS